MIRLSLDQLNLLTTEQLRTHAVELGSNPDAPSDQILINRIMSRQNYLSKRGAFPMLCMCGAPAADQSAGDRRTSRYCNGCSYPVR